jgi:hypothetical protein
MWTKDGTVATVHEHSSSMTRSSWNDLVYICQQNETGFSREHWLRHTKRDGALKVMETIAGTTEMVTALLRR